MFTSFSNIEFHRCRRLGKKSRIRFLADDGDAGGYTKLEEVLSHFLIGRRFNTATGSKTVYLTIDVMDKDFDITKIANEASFVDLVKPDGTYDRYVISTESSPTSQQNRWHFELIAEFGNQTPIA